VEQDLINVAARFVDLDRQTPMFLPYDLREREPAGHIVQISLEAVEQLLPRTSGPITSVATGIL